MMKNFSIIIPTLNEADNINPLAPTDRRSYSATGVDSRDHLR